MTSNGSRAEYERRMHRVIAYIDQNLDGTPDLSTLAEVAHFSPFHFHRLFSAWMGETLGDYLRRRRVEVAAMRLASQPRTTILNLALSVGFGSAEAFARAFRSRFGCSPTAWRTQQATPPRANSNPDQTDSKMGQMPVTRWAEHEASFTPHTEIGGRQIGQAWTALLREWLPSSGLQLRSGIQPRIDPLGPKFMTSAHRRLPGPQRRWPQTGSSPLCRVTGGNRIPSDPTFMHKQVTPGF